jgi:hypothetical protein
MVSFIVSRTKEIENLKLCKPISLKNNLIYITGSIVEAVQV